MMRMSHADLLVWIDRTRVQQQTQLQNDLEYERSRSNEQRNQIMKLEADNSALQTSEMDLSELIADLRRQINSANEEMRRSQLQEGSQLNAAEKVSGRDMWSGSGPLVELGHIG